MSQEEKFIEFLENYKNLIVKVASMYCASKDNRNDLVQDIIVQLWKAFPRYDNKFALSTWTYRIALNVSISFLRKEYSRKRTFDGFQQQVDLLYYEDDQMNERLSFLYQQLEHLKPIDKAIIILHLDGRMNKEVAEIMGLSASNISTIIHRVKTTLSIKAKSLTTI